MSFETREMAFSNQINIHFSSPDEEKWSSKALTQKFKTVRVYREIFLDSYLTSNDSYKKAAKLYKVAL